MQLEDLILVSVDDHLIEPPDVFVRHVADKCPEKGVTDLGEVNKITHEKALRWCGYVPFSVVPKQKGTVGVLRSQATDVNTGIRSRAAFRESYRTES